MRNTILLSFLILVSMGSGIAQIPNVDLGLKNDKIDRNVEHIAFIDRIQNGESFTIGLKSMGCFGGSESKMTISNESGQYYVLYMEQKIKLTEADIEDFRGFEQELVNIKKGYCTSTDTYTLKYNEQTYSQKDSTCSWNGFSRLRKKFDKNVPKS